MDRTLSVYPVSCRPKENPLHTDPHAQTRFTGISFASEERDYAYLRHYSCQNSRYQIVSLRLHCTRDPTYYVFRIVGVMLMVSVLKLCTSLVPLVDYNTKVGFSQGNCFTVST